MDSAENDVISLSIISFCVIGGALSLRRAIAADISRRLQCPWTPPIQELKARWQDNAQVRLVG